MVEEQNLTNEQIINVSLRAARFSSRSRRADTAIKIIKEQVAKYTKSDMGMIWVDNKVNEALWSRGRKHIPTK